MPFTKKALPRPSLQLVLSPESDPDYVHFEDAREAPFDSMAKTFSRVNAWWMADSALLSYWGREAAEQRFRDRAGLQSAFVERRGTQAYVAWNDRFACVAFRGTESRSILDLVTDARIPFVRWDSPGEQVHAGFKDALEEVWPGLMAVLTTLGDRPVWFTGHSLGGALATLAGDRFTRVQASAAFGELGGIYTFGSPLVGDRPFVDGFNARCGDRSFRFVNDQDAVTRVPPPLLGYRHVNHERFVGFDDPTVWLSEPLIDHTPRRYAVLVWNAFVEAALPATPAT